jgi:dethiobiotin synthetase
VKRSAAQRIIFITGTDTGVGKTLLTCLLLHHLRRTGCHALAMKPFSSGGRADARLLQALQGGELTLHEINPFYFEEPLAPLVAARQHHSSIALREVLERISAVADRCQCLLIEGIGGLLVPLGEGYSVADVAAKLRCRAIIVSANRLGTVNHTMLTVKYMQAAGCKGLKVVLMSQGEPDLSAGSNGPILAELLQPVPVLALGFLGRDACRSGALRRIEKKVEKSVARILA